MLSAAGIYLNLKVSESPPNVQLTCFQEGGNTPTQEPVLEVHVLSLLGVGKERGRKELKLLGPPK